MKVFAWVALGCALFLGSRAPAVEAIGSYDMGGYSTLYAPGGAGFGFSPKTKIAITALGFGSASLNNGPYEVMVWNAQGVQLGSVLVSATSPLLNQTRYEPIKPILLDAGQTNYIAAVGTNGYWLGYEIRGGSLPPGSFSVASDLSYVGDALGTNSLGVFPYQVGSSSNLFLGANFLYNTGPFILITNIQAQTSPAQIRFTLQGGPPTTFTLLQSTSLVGSWVPNRNAVLTTNALGSAYTFTVPTNGLNQFYRVQAP